MQRNSMRWRGAQSLHIYRHPVTNKRISCLIGKPMRYPHLFKPLTLNKLTLRNRIVSTAHAEVYAEPGGLPGDRYIRYYEEKAKGGVGLAVCGGSSPVSIDSPQGWWKSVNLATDKVVDPLSRLAEAMHKHGAKIMIQAT